jgi:F-type H+-transporting ATPase subunit epsilon
MAASGLPTKIQVEIVSQEGLLLRETIDELIAPGADGYFGVRPGHTPMLAALGNGSIWIRIGSRELFFSCFGGFCEVLPDRVNILAEIGERADAIDAARAEEAKKRAAERMKTIKDEAGFNEAHEAYVRAVTRLAVARGQRAPGA